MIQYTGNAFVDAGTAVLEHRLKKACASFSADDLASQAQSLEAEYARPIWKSYLTIHFPNSAWVQPKISAVKKRAYIDKVLGSYKVDPLNPPRHCTFCGQAAQAIVDRSHFPLLTGETIMVAGANGEPGLPICGYCIFSAQFYPLTTLKVAGRPLFWWAPEAVWTRALTRRFYHDVERILSVSSDKFLNLRWPSTQLLRAARDVVEEMYGNMGSHLGINPPPLCDIIGVHATNYGSGPDYDELRIPRSLLEFWSEARSSFGAMYQQIETAAWENEANPKKGTKQKPSEPSPVPELARRNRLYEALGGAFRSSDFRHEAKRIASRFFLRRNGKVVEPNTTALAEFFLEKVADMEKIRLEAIREIADSVANSRDAKWLVDKLMRSGRRLYDYIPVMRMVQQKLSAEQKSISWDKFLLAFNLASDEDATASDTWLVGELILIRIFEQLAREKASLLAEISVPEEVQSVAHET